MDLDSLFEGAVVAQLHLPLRETIPADTALRKTLQQMREHGRSAMLVVDGERLTGLFTDVDYVRNVLGRDIAADATIRDVMTADVTTVTGDTKLSRAFELMSRGNFRNLPVVDGQGRPIGLLRIVNLMQYLAERYPAEILAMAPDVHQVVEADGG